MSIFHQDTTFLGLPSVIGPAGSFPQDDVFQGKKAAAKQKKNTAKGTDAHTSNTQARANPQQNIMIKSRTSIQVITHLTSDTRAPAILLQTAKGDRHFFGRFGEGLQRVLNQNRIKFSHVKNIFISGPLTWESVGGLPGIILTLADQGVSKISLQTAVDNLSWACATWRSFIFRGDLGFNINNVEKSLYCDEFICVKGLAIYPDSLTPIEYHSKSIDYHEIDKKSREIFNQIFHNPNKPSEPQKNRVEGTGSDLSAVSNLSLPATEKDSRVSCFIIQVLPTRGKFLPKKAISLGVPAGVMFSKLTNGESVTTPEGKTVNPQDVLEPSKVNSRILVIDCPSEEYVNNIVTRNDWRQSLHPDYATAEQSVETDIFEGYAEPVSVAYHILGKEVNPFEGRYYKWLTAPDSPVFKNDCMHFITHPDYAPDGISFDSAALLNMRLRNTFPENFKRLYTANLAKKFPEPVTNHYKIYPMISQGIVSVEPRIMYQSNFEKCGGKVDYETLEGNFTNSAETKGLSIDSGVETHLQNIKVVTLGTGSAIPNKYRNVISTLVIIPGTISRSILFDCGEATLGNMRRLYGPKGLRERVEQIGILYISHLHADHHLGAVSFINEWLQYTKNQPEKVLYVMGPWKYFEFLEEWSHLEPSINLERLRFVDNEGFIIGNGFMDNPNALKPRKECKFWNEELKEDLGLVYVKTCKAIHCELAYCVTLQFSMNHESDFAKDPAAFQKQKTFTVSYSGDTRPTETFAHDVGTGSDLLIHEATHENGLEMEAFKKRHSTISEAVGIAYKMKAKYTVLTHFSQRYPKLPSMAGLDYEGKEDHGDEDEREKVCRHEDLSLDTDPNNCPPPVFQIPANETPEFALAFDGLHLKLEDIPKQKYKFAELTKMFSEVGELDTEEEEVE